MSWVYTNTHASGLLLFFYSVRNAISSILNVILVYKLPELNDFIFELKMLPQPPFTSPVKFYKKKQYSEKTVKRAI